MAVKIFEFLVPRRNIWLKQGSYGSLKTWKVMEYEMSKRVQNVKRVLSFSKVTLHKTATDAIKFFFQVFSKKE